MVKINENIRKAIFPVAGIGTRMLPLTKSISKEMLPIINKPLIQYAVEEAYASGIREMIFVINKRKADIEMYFHPSQSLKETLLNQGKKELYGRIQNILPPDMKCKFIYQNKQMGLGHAVLCAEKYIDKDEAFAVLLPDDFLIYKKPVIQQLINTYNQYSSAVIALQAVPKEKVQQYGILEGKAINSKVYQAKKLIEKPKPAETQSTLAIVGRYILPHQIFGFLKHLPSNANSELQLTDALAMMLQKASIYGYLFDGSRFDCGSILGFLEASISTALKDDDIAPLLKQWITTVNKR